MYFEHLLLHVDMETRRSEPFREPVATRLAEVAALVGKAVQHGPGQGVLGGGPLGNLGIVVQPAPGEFFEFAQVRGRVFAPVPVLARHGPPVASAAAITGISFIGLCHGVQTTLDLISRYVDVPKDEIDTLVAGINHMAWFLSLKDKRSGRDLYPKFRRNCAATPTERLGLYSCPGFNLSAGADAR